MKELRSRLESLEAERRSIHEKAGDSALSEDQQTRWDELDKEESEVRDELAKAEEVEARAERVAESRARWGSSQVSVRKTAADTDTSTRMGLVDANLRAVEGRMDNTDRFRSLLRRHSSDRRWAENMLARSRPEYSAAFSKLMVGRAELLTSEERTAVAVGTNSQGGYLVPTFLDPTLVLTNAGTSNIIRSLSKEVTLTYGNIYHGVSTAGSTASWDGELVETSDDSPSFSSIAIPLYKAASFIQASEEAFEDVDGLAQDIAMLFADERARIEGSAHATGNGTTQPKGVFTAVAAVGGSTVTSTTAATIGLIDIHAVYKALPVRNRAFSTWIANPLYTTAIRQLGTALSASWSGYLDAPTGGAMLGRPFMESDDAPNTQTTTALDPELLLGNFNNYIIVDKPGSTAIEFIPQLFNTANNLPDGRRGWRMHFRQGADVAYADSFRLLVDKTSA